MIPKRRQFWFDKDMERDVEDIKQHFMQKFNIVPSDTEILNLLLKTYKESQLSIKRKPRRKRLFEIAF